MNNKIKARLWLSPLVVIVIYFLYLIRPYITTRLIIALAWAMVIGILIPVCIAKYCDYSMRDD